MTTQIDRLEAQLRFNAGAGQMSELVRGGRDILKGVQAIAANAQQLANDLAGLHGTPVPGPSKDLFGQQQIATLGANIGPRL